jgi:hypothetical protein
MMSKEKRQKRFQQKDRHIERQFDIAKTHHHGYYNDNNKHKLHKKHAMNCGVPGCLMCANPRRTWGEKTLPEIKFECSAVEQTNRDSIGNHEWQDLNDPAMEW